MLVDVKISNVHVYLLNYEYDLYFFKKDVILYVGMKIKKWLPIKS